MFIKFVFQQLEHQYLDSNTFVDAIQKNIYAVDSITNHHLKHIIMTTEKLADQVINNCFHKKYKF